MLKLDIEKTIQAVGVLLREEQGRMPYLRLVKLLYVAEREALRRAGHMIVGDRIVAMKHGPVLSGVLDLIKGLHLETARWAEFFQRERYDEVLVRQPGVDRLSAFEIELLQELSREHAQLNEWELVDMTHQFPEWENPGATSKPISVASILEAVGRGADAEAIEAELSEFAFMRELLG